MEAKEFVRERRRMCGSHNLCLECPLEHMPCGCVITEEGVDLVEQWSNEHKILTNRMKFQEVFGRDIGYGKWHDICDNSYFGFSKKWWDEPWKEKLK